MQANGEAIAIGHMGVTGPNLAKVLREMVLWLEDRGLSWFMWLICGSNAAAGNLLFYFT
ncbi:MAG: hypothetical protein ACOY3H_05590 [Bacillota bacterium]